MDWFSAWSIFQSVLIPGKNNVALVPKMAKHCQQVQQLMEANLDWRAYDQSVREMIQDGTMAWGDVNMMLIVIKNIHKAPAANGSKHLPNQIPNWCCMKFHTKSFCE